MVHQSGVECILEVADSLRGVKGRPTKKGCLESIQVPQYEGAEGRNFYFHQYSDL